MNKLLLRLIFIAPTLFCASFSAIALKLPPPPTKAMLAGAWTGPEDSGSVIRLELNASGQGLLVIAARGQDSKPSVYRITLEKIDVYKLFFLLVPLGDADKTFDINGSFALPRALKLVRHFNEHEDSWSLSSLLVRDEDMRRGVENTKKASVQIHSEEGR